MNPIIIAGLLLVLCPVIAFFVIKPDGKYHCSITGCNRSFEQLGNYVTHLKKTHNYSDEMIEDVMEMIAFLKK